MILSTSRLSSKEWVFCSPSSLARLSLLNCNYDPLAIMQTLLSSPRIGSDLPRLGELKCYWRRTHRRLTHTGSSEGDEDSRAWFLQGQFVTQFDLQERAQQLADFLPRPMHVLFESQEKRIEDF